MTASRAGGSLSAAGWVLSVIITIFGLLLVTFLIGRVIPVDPVLAIVGDQASPEVYERARTELGLDRPLVVQFFEFSTKMLMGDFGRSVATSRPVMDDIFRYFPATLELATIATLLGVLIGVPAGIIAAVKRDTLFDQVVRVAVLAGHSIPIFVLGLLALLIFYGRLAWLPGPGRLGIAYEGLVPTTSGVLLLDAALAGEWDAFWDAVQHLILPSCVLAYASLAYIARMTRSFILEQLQQEYVIAARVKGMPEHTVIFRHVLKNITVPLITVVAYTYASLLEGSVITETVFSWPGLGQYLTVSLLNADMNAVLGATLVVGFVFLCVNQFSDLLYRFFDARTR